MLEFHQDPRAYWSPNLAHWFGIHPWMMVDVTTGEYRAMGEWLKKASEQNG